MKVRIVVNEAKSDWIIARLARHLVKLNGWSARKKPNPRALVNLFFPYCEWRFSKFARTPIGAWFTHREHESVEHGAKRRRWDLIWPVMDLRAMPSRLWASQVMDNVGWDQAHMQRVIIPHPVELDFFQPTPQRKGKPVIGVSGTCYSGGRKGEVLVARLNGEYHNKYTVLGSGKGWLVPTKWRKWKHMPAYYSHLNLFLCTSLNEGGPVTVLEALASGRPVVIPWGVGEMDALPEGAGIRHYHKGDYNDMVRAIRDALDDHAPPESLRAVVEDRTPQRWAGLWDDVVHNLLDEMAA